MSRPSTSFGKPVPGILGRGPPGTQPGQHRYLDAVRGVDQPSWSPPVSMEDEDAVSLARDEAITCQSILRQIGA